MSELLTEIIPARSIEAVEAALPDLYGDLSVGGIAISGFLPSEADLTNKVAELRQRKAGKDAIEEAKREEKTLTTVEYLTRSEGVEYRQQGKNYANQPQFLNIARVISRSLGAGSDDYSVSYLGTFIGDQGWHLPMRTEQPRVRVWVHLRGEVELLLARAKEDIVTDALNSEEDILRDSYALPSLFVPRIGDALVFIDRGTPGVTGTSTLHRSIVEPRNSSRRMSTAMDVIPHLS